MVLETCPYDTPESDDLVLGPFVHKTYRSIDGSVHRLYREEVVPETRPSTPPNPTTRSVRPRDLRISIRIYTSSLPKRRGVRYRSFPPHRGQQLSLLTQETNGPLDGPTLRLSRRDVVLETYPSHPVYSDDWVYLSLDLQTYTSSLPRGRSSRDVFSPSNESHNLFRSSTRFTDL